MFGSQVLDTIIGLVTLFLVLALGASSAVEAVSRVLSKRAKDLEAGIKAMLAGSNATDEDLEKVFAVFAGTTIYDSAKAAAGKSLFRREWKRPSYLSAKAFGDAMEALKKQAADPGSEIAKLLNDAEIGDTVRDRVKEVVESGSAAVLDPMVSRAASDVTAAGEVLKDAENAVVGAKQVLDAEADVSKKPAAEAALDEAKTALDEAKTALDEAKTALENAWDDASAQVTAWKAELESWFDDTMDRVSGAYKRFTTLWLFVFGLIFAIGANGSAFHVAQELWTDPVTADAVADAVSNVITENTSEETATTTTTVADTTTTTVAGTTTTVADITTTTVAAAPITVADGGNSGGTTVQADDPNNPFDSDIESIANATAQLEELQIPIGWSAADWDEWREDWYWPFDWSGHQWALFFGWIVSALLVMQGAPFWFDALTKAVSLRNAGGKPSLAINDDTSATSAVIKNQSGNGRGGGPT